jgi:GTP cyclohydrolase I
MRKTVKKTSRRTVKFANAQTDKHSLTEEKILNNLREILAYIGDDPSREGLLETPHRILRSWKKLYGGYQMKPQDVLKTFTEGSCEEMVVLKDIEFYSTCEHHLQPFFGTISIGYLPKGRVLGISKLARLVEVFARRLQIQEKFILLVLIVMQVGMFLLITSGIGLIMKINSNGGKCLGILLTKTMNKMKLFLSIQLA